jgi:general secretion pathway protein G
MKEDLALLRDAIDKHFSDLGKYPDTLNGLVGAKYLRKIPVDPVTERANTWVVIAPQDPKLGGMYDVKRSAGQGA